MALPFISGKKDEEFFVSFVVGKNWVQAGIWNVQENKGVLLSAGTSSPWQEDPPDSFVEAADDSLSSAVGNLEKEPKLEKAVFGLSPQWIDNGKVKLKELSLLKKLCDTLELKPSGFVIIPEALVFAIKQKDEGAGVSFILVGLVEDEIEITLVSNGKIADTTYVSRSISLGDDITEGLVRFGTENLQSQQAGLPPRIILYNHHTNELNEVKSELSSWEWSSSVFNHAPRIEVLPTDSVISAVSEAGAIEVAHVTKFIDEAQETQEPKEEEIDKQDLVASTKVTDKINEDSAKENAEPDLQEPDIINPLLAKTHFPEQESGQITQTDLVEREINPNKISKLIPHIPNLFSFRPKGFIIVLAFLLFLGFGAFILLPKATATIYLNPQKLEDRLEIIVSPTGGGNGKLPARVISGELTGEKTRNTSGHKTVGDRAKGEIIILNNTSSTKSFQPGTVLVGPNGLKFTLDGAVTIASESGAPNYKPGETKGQVVANDIGAEYNLALGNIFSISNFSTNSFSARNDSSFSGGSSREIASIEKEDQSALEKDLTSEIQERALRELTPQLGPTEILIPESTKISISSRSFSGKPGDEADTLNLRLTVRTDLIAVSKTELEDHIRKALAGKIPAGLVLQNGHIKVAFSPQEGKKEEKGTDQRFTLNVTALLLPNTNPKELANKISGKTLTDAQKELSALPGFVRTTIKFSPPLPEPLNRFPIRGDNIMLNIEPEE